jgi:hypothetical protein
MASEFWVMVYYAAFNYRAPDNFQVQRVITPYFWKWWVFAYFFCTVVLSTSEKIAYKYTFKIMFDTSYSINTGCKWNVYLCLIWHDCVMFINKML